MSEWTKGPISREFDYLDECRVEFEDGGNYITLSTQGRELPVAFVIGTPGCRWDNDPEQEANANLYAAAPTMAEALEAVREWLRHDVPVGTPSATVMLTMVNAALSLAKGEDRND
jgi:hypothetical protein